MSKPSRISISEEELEKIKTKKIYLVIERELQQQGENRQIKNKRAYPSFLLNAEESKLKEKELLETGTIDDGNGMFWMDVIALLLSNKTSILYTQNEDMHKLLSKEEILKWFQTLRSSVLFINSILEYNSRIRDRDKEDLTVRQKNEDLKSSNEELESKNKELSAIAREAMNWAKLTNINDVNFSSNFKI